MPLAESPAPKSLRILVCGNRSFAARGLTDLLRSRGHHVTTFNRGPLRRTADDVTGPVDALASNPELTGSFDAVLNYILLKDGTIDQNNAFIDQLLAFCAAHNVPHYIHLSSVSVYAGRLGDVYETSPVEEVPTRKGAYGSLKVATDLHLVAKAPPSLNISFVRPGFILGKGMVDPIVGMALRSWWNTLWILGSEHNSLPVITRTQVNEALTRIVESEPTGQNAFLLADPKSPTRRQWLNDVCRVLGAGTGTFAVPVPLWRIAGFAGVGLTTALGMKVRPNTIVRNMCRVQRFHPEATAKRLGMDLSVNWPEELRQAYDEQIPNFKIPFKTLSAPNPSLKKITFIGYGGIVKQKHLPALKTINFSGTIDAFDVAARTDPDGTVIKPLDNANIGATDLVVVASPGHVHNSAIPLLASTNAPVLIEKPLCYTKPEVDEWLNFAQSRAASGAGGVYICHNFRFKPVVARMMQLLHQSNPGELLHADILFQSPSIGKEWRTWTKDERRARTLLMDYSVHFLDLACMFSSKNWALDSARYKVNNENQTSLIQGSFKGDYSVHFVLRQGFIPRKAEINFVFQNYNCTLSFFPDTFTASQGAEGPILYRQRGAQVLRGIREKVVDKLTKKDRDNSHPAAYLAATTAPDLGSGVRVENLASLYNAVTQLGEAVYGPSPR